MLSCAVSGRWRMLSAAQQAEVDQLSRTHPQAGMRLKALAIRAVAGGTRGSKSVRFCMFLRTRSVSGIGPMRGGAGQPWRFIRVGDAAPEPRQGRWRNMSGNRRATSACRAPAGPCSFWRRRFPVWPGCTPAPSGICCAAWGSATNAPSPGSTAPTRTTLKKTLHRSRSGGGTAKPASPEGPLYG